MSIPKNPLDELRSAVLKLKPTGLSGFEGLIAAVFREITGVHFRLAASGRQDGIDGATTSTGETIVFECKRYNGPIPRSDLVAKLADFARRCKAIDTMWVLVATVEIPTQLASELTADGESLGVIVTLLDWSDSGLSRLATALASANAATLNFMDKSEQIDSIQKQALRNALSDIQRDSSFATAAHNLQNELKCPSRALALARQANRMFLKKALGSKPLAKVTFGQSLTPSAKNIILQPRKYLIAKITQAFNEVRQEPVWVVHGSEGCGKSWAVMQSWCKLENPSLTLFMTTHATSRHTSINEIFNMLIELTSEQAGETPTEENSNRWRHRWKRMKLADAPLRPCLIVVLDGLNQQPDTRWPHMIELLSELLKEVGGALIITARTDYYLSSIRPHLDFDPFEVDVHEWTDSERDTILKSKNIDPSTLEEKVLKSLANPRLMGISLDLLNKKALKGLHELDISRLLFEHIRTCARVNQGAPSPDGFARELRDHAFEVRQRLENQQKDDLRVFDKEGLSAVVDGLFFKSLTNDSTKYELHPRGLTLALGFALVGELQKAKRNKRCVREAAIEMMEPFTASDESPEVILAGLHVLCLDDQKYDMKLVACLLHEFARAQNPHPSLLSAVRGHARRRVEAFLQALEEYYLATRTLSHATMLEECVWEAFKDKGNHKIIDDWIRRWFKSYTCSINYGLVGNHQASMDKQEANNVQESAQRKIDSNVKSLSAKENEYLSSLVSQEGNVFALHEMAFRLLAGRPLATFASELVSVRFITTLNTSYTRAGNLFLELCRFNNCDWSQMRIALKEESIWLCDSGISKIGRWTRVGLLHATGSLMDATEADNIARRLRHPHPLYFSWNRNESYCDTDPCDPNAQRPTNLQKAIDRLDEFVPAEYALDRQPSSGTMSLKDALLPLARHRPKLIIEAIGCIIDDVAERSGLSLQYGLFALESHRALVTHDQAVKFVDLSLDRLGKNYSDESDDNRRNTLRQFGLLLGFHNFEGDRQLEILISDPIMSAILLSLIPLLKPATDSMLQNTLCETNWISSNFPRIQAVLAFLTATKPILTEAQSRSISECFNTDNVNLALHTLMFATELKDKVILQRFLESNWAPKVEVDDCSAWLDRRNRAFIQAGCLKLINIDEVISTISPEYFGIALRYLGGTTAPHIINILLGYMNLEAPQWVDADNVSISQLQRTDLIDLAPVTFMEDDLPQDDPATVHQLLTETQKEWNERQRRAYNRGQKFVDSVHSAGLGVLLSDFDSMDITVLLEKDDDMGPVLTEYITNIQPAKRPLFRNFALALAYALAYREDDEAAMNLLENYQYCHSSIELSVGISTLSVETLNAWSGPSTTFLNAHRFRRLDEAVTDHNIAQEVLAAEQCSKRELLHSYIEDLSERLEPSRISRAIMVAGFMDENEVSTALLDRYRNADGFIGTTTKAARFSYQRNSWAQHWHKQMQMATTPEDFWCAQMLFEKIVDGRFAIWSTQPKEDSFAEQHRVLVQSRVKARCKKWREKRKLKLFGASIPDDYVLASIRNQTSSTS